MMAASGRIVAALLLVGSGLGLPGMAFAGLQPTVATYDEFGRVLNSVAQGQLALPVQRFSPAPTGVVELIERERTGAGWRGPLVIKGLEPQRMIEPAPTDAARQDPGTPSPSGTADRVKPSN